MRRFKSRLDVGHAWGPFWCARRPRWWSFGLAVDVGILNGLRPSAMASIGPWRFGVDL